MHYACLSVQDGVDFWRAAAENALPATKRSWMKCLEKCWQFRRTDIENAHHDDGEDTREARAARRAEMREQRQVEVLAQASMHGPRRGKRQRRSGREEAETEYTSTSDEQGNSDVEVSSRCLIAALLCAAACRRAFSSAAGALAHPQEAQEALLSP